MTEKKPKSPEKLAREKEHAAREKKRIALVQDLISKRVIEISQKIAADVIDEYGRCRGGYINIQWDDGNKVHHTQFTTGNKD